MEVKGGAPVVLYGCAGATASNARSRHFAFEDLEAEYERLRFRSSIYAAVCVHRSGDEGSVLDDTWGNLI